MRTSGRLILTRSLRALSNASMRAAAKWRVELARIRWEILDAFRAAAAEAGIAKVEDFNGGDNEGCGYFHVNQRTGVRWNTSKAFLRPVKHRRNLIIETEALVERLTLEGKRVTGLVLKQGGRRRTLRARCEVILCAGAIGSPQILQLSGIGAGAMLKGLGIAVTHELKGSGKICRITCRSAALTRSRARAL